MNHLKNLRTVALVSVSAVVLGCASKPEIIRIDPPGVSAAPRKEVQVLLLPPEDNREFHENAGSPDAPSLSARYADRAEIRARAVGRKRNMYNEAEGELLLDADDTVNEWAARMASDALSSGGYETVRDPMEAAEDAAGMRVVIDELWVWNDATAFRNIIKGKIALSISFNTDNTDGSAPLSIRAAATRETRVPGRQDWQNLLIDLHIGAVEQLKALLDERPPMPGPPDITAAPDTAAVNDADEAGEISTDRDTDSDAPPAEDTDTDTDTAA